MSYYKNRLEERRIETENGIIEISKAKVAAFIFVINLFDLGGCDKLQNKNYIVENLMEFPGH